MSGWAILLDYLLLPGLLCIFAAAAMHLQSPPTLPEWVWVPVFVLVSTVINLRGITFTAGVNLACLYLQLGRSGVVRRGSGGGLFTSGGCI